MRTRGLGTLGDVHQELEEILVRGVDIEGQVARLRPDDAHVGLDNVGAVQDLLCICVHPTLPMDRQIGMLLRFGVWLPNDAVARVLELDPSTVGIHLRQSCRRLRAVARRGARSWSTGKDQHALTVLQLLDRLRRRSFELAEGAPKLAEAIAADTRRYGELFLESEIALVRAEAHAFLAEMLLGDERARRNSTSGDPGLPLRMRAVPTEDAMAKGLRHLKEAKELGAKAAFVWQAGIHASYLLAGDRSTIDWQQLVGLYEGLLRASGSDRRVSSTQ